MGSSKTSVAMVCVLALILANLSCAQDSPQDYVNPHNTARAQIGVGPISRDANLAAYAMNYAKNLMSDHKLVHSGGPYGENLAGSSGDLTGTAAVNMWVGEKPQNYYNSNSCVGGECLHCTQVVWRNSVRLGCAKAGAKMEALSSAATMNPRETVSGSDLSKSFPY